MSALQLHLPRFQSLHVHGLKQRREAESRVQEVRACSAAASASLSRSSACARAAAPACDDCARRSAACARSAASAASSDRASASAAWLSACALRRHRQQVIRSRGNAVRQAKRGPHGFQGPLQPPLLARSLSTACLSACLLSMPLTQEKAHMGKLML